MTLGSRPRAGGEPYAAARRCGVGSDHRSLGDYGSPPARACAGTTAERVCHEHSSMHSIPACAGMNG